MELGISYDTVVIGGGLAGTTVASELARLAPAGLRMLLVERAEPGPGSAYAPLSERVFMNGSADAMSAAPDDKHDLVRWLRTLPGEALIPRRLFGRYLAERFRASIAGRPGFDVARTQAVDVMPVPNGFVVVGEDGVQRRTRTVVLALGNFPPDDSFLPEALREHPNFVADPWRCEPSRAPGDALVIGSGLTAMDAIALLEERGFAARVHVVS